MQNTYIDNLAHKLLHTFEKIDAINPTFEQIYLVSCSNFIIHHRLLNTSLLPANSSILHVIPLGSCVRTQIQIITYLETAHVSYLRVITLMAGVYLFSFVKQGLSPNTISTSMCFLTFG